MAITGIAGVSKAPETTAVARVAANPYQTTVVRPDISGQPTSPMQVANDQFLERKISERQSFRRVAQQDAQDRIMVSREAQTAWIKGAAKVSIEQTNQERTRGIEKTAVSIQEKETMNKAQVAKNNGNVGSLLDLTM